jgi:hypothetical protein
MTAIPKQTELEKLSEKMAKILSQLDKSKTVVREDNFQSQKKVKTSYKWGYYAHQKTLLMKEIDRVEGSEYDKNRAKNGTLHKK